MPWIHRFSNARRLGQGFDSARTSYGDFDSGTCRGGSPVAGYDRDLGRPGLAPRSGRCRRKSASSTTGSFRRMSIANPPLVLARSPATLARDYTELTKLRVTSLVVMTAWCGYYFGAARSGISSLSWGLAQALVGVALVAGGAAALNEVMEFDIGARTSGVGRCGDVRHRVLLAVSALFFDRMALSRRLCGRSGPHVAGGGTGRALQDRKSTR